jgi:hypothetical protein
MTIALVQERFTQLGVDHYDRARDLPNLLDLTPSAASNLETNEIVEALGTALNKESQLRYIGHHDHSFMRMVTLEASLRAELLRFATENTVVYHHDLIQMRNVRL